MKLVYQKVLPIKHIPFNEEENIAKNYPIVFNLPASMTGGLQGMVANLSFHFRYQCQVPDRLINQPVSSSEGQFLHFKLVQSEEFSYHHSKDLDRHQFLLEISNGTREFTKQLYFNKPQMSIGFIDIKPSDRLSLKFSVVKNGGGDAKELI